MWYRFPTRLAPAVLAAACTSAAAAVAPTPALDAIFRPVFATPQGPLRAGTAFVAHLDRCTMPILVTAMHLFGPDGGLGKSMDPESVRRGVKHVALTRLDGTAKPLSLAVASVTPPGATTCCGKKPMVDSGDVAAFTLPGTLASIALPLATLPPYPGQHVTLLAEMADGPASGWRHGAFVLGVKEGALYYKFDEPELQLQATSGAPVIDDDGAVVAINLFSGHLLAKLPTTLIGGGNPVAAWRADVETACQALR